VGIAHFDQGPVLEHELGHIRGRWTNVGVAAGLGVVARLDYWDGED